MPADNYKISDRYIGFQLDDRKYLLVSENSGVLIQSKVAQEILKAIQKGGFGINDILEKYADFGPMNEVFEVVRQLEAQGLIREAKPCRFSSEGAFWEEMEIDPGRLSEVLERKPVEFISLGKEEEHPFISLCGGYGIRSSPDPFLRIVLTNDYYSPELEKINQKAIKEKKPWMLMRLHGATPWIGPLFLPQEENQPCWKCMEYRLLQNSPEIQFFDAYKGSKVQRLPRPSVYHPAMEMVTLNAAFLELVKYLYHGEGKYFQNGILVFSARTGEREWHPLVWRPQCIACGDPMINNRFPDAIRLEDNRPVVRKESGFRTVSPEVTLAKYKNLISPLTGVVPYLTKREAFPDAPFRNYTSGMNTALFRSGNSWLNEQMRKANGGKGKSDAQSQASALCESIERYSSVYTEDRFSVRGTIDQLEDAIHPNDCMGFSKLQYEEREVTNAIISRLQGLVPIPFRQDQEVDWSPVYSLTEKRFKYLPTMFCYNQYPVASDDERFAYPDSNGCAAGNTIEEAVLQGILELIERDAAAIWWYNRLKMPHIDLDTSNSEFISQARSYFKGLGRSLHVLDLTHDLNIPVFAAISYNPSPSEPDESIFAFGAHLDRKIAVERAILEVCQILPSTIKKDGKYSVSDSVFVDWLETVKLEENDWLMPGSELGKDLEADYPKVFEPEILPSIDHCLESLRRNGIEVLVLDMTQPDIGLPVVRVIAPGLRHFWRRTGPGRLYDVPVKMGWRKEPMQESDLNPLSVFI